MKLYYLTPPQFALSALALRRLKVARLAELNDPFELMAIDAEGPLHREFFRRVKERVNATHGVLCFSRGSKNPVLWGHYADKLRGVALGFEVTSPHLVSVIYETLPLQVSTSTDAGLPQLNHDVVDRLQRTKFEDWRYENEMRVYVQLDHAAQEFGLYFYPFDASLAAGVGPGSEVSFSLDGGKIVITPVASPIKNDRRAKLRAAAAKVRSSLSPEFKQLGAQEIVDFLRGDSDAIASPRRGRR